LSPYVIGWSSDRPQKTRRRVWEPADHKIGITSIPAMTGHILTGALIIPLTRTLRTA